MRRFYYRNQIPQFLSDSNEQILGVLAAGDKHANLVLSQRNAWLVQIQNLKEQLADFQQGQIFLEFSIPRMGKRVDVALLIKNIIFIIEYKTDAKAYDRSAHDQVLDYALDLKDFHEGSHYRKIIPILVATAAPAQDNHLIWNKNNVSYVFKSNGTDLNAIIKMALPKSLPNFTLSGVQEDPKNDYEAGDWSESAYKPTPTIIEAAQALYKGHSVEEISRSDAGAQNLTRTSDCIFKIIEDAKQNNKKSICFVTGVPGAGKTLAGLNISNQKGKDHAMFLSGNGPLVTVLQEALIRDKMAQKTSRGDAERQAKGFIQNIHHFRDDGIGNEKPPIDHVVIFDEAQRAWSKKQTEKFMSSKRGIPNFGMSEPEFLISYLDRASDWRVIVCLIGGGQEINTGEAGLIEWFNAIEKRFNHWNIYYSNQLTNKTYNWGQDLQHKLRLSNALEKEELHLSVSLRSYRAEKLSDFVSAIIEGNAEEAKNLHTQLDKYPLAITRNLNKPVSG